MSGQAGDPLAHRARSYRKPLWLRLTVTGLVICLSLIVSQVILRDREMFAHIRSAAEKVGQFVAVEVAHRKAQEAGAAQAPVPQAVQAGPAEPGRGQGQGQVRVNRPGAQGAEAGGFKRVRVGE